MRTGLYDRQGKPMSLEDWGSRLEKDKSYRRVAETTLPNGLYVSTVWLGIDHSFGEGPPLIFESMAFQSQAPGEFLGPDLDQMRYSTEEEALAGHKMMVAKWMATEGPR
jgi:hypothetical protein